MGQNLVLKILRVDEVSARTKEGEFEFERNSGMQVSVEDEEDILQYFQLFIWNDLEIIATETNEYAKQYLEENRNAKPRPRAKDWVDMSAAEIKTLLGLLLLQGIVNKPVIKLYFLRRESIAIATPFFWEVMSGKRFHLLLKFLHFVDSKTFDAQSSNKKLFKIKLVLDYLLEKFKST